MASTKIVFVTTDQTAWAISGNDVAILAAGSVEAATPAPVPVIGLAVHTGIRLDKSLRQHKVY